MTEDDLQAAELRAHVHEQESGSPHVEALADDVRALVAEVRRRIAREDMRKAFGVSLKPPPKGLYENMATTGIPRCPQCHRIVHPDATYCVGCKYVPPT